MGFRNPPRFARHLSTASSGKRIDIADDRISWYTGNPQELFPGTMTVGANANQGFVSLKPPDLGTGLPLPGGPILDLYGQNRAGSSAGFAQLGGDWRLGNSLNPVTASSAAGREYVESVTRIASRPYTPAASSIPSGSFRQSGVGADPFIADFFLTRACTVSIRTGWRLGVASAGVGVALYSIIVDGTSRKQGVMRSIDETRELTVDLALAKGWHDIELRADASGGAINWFNSDITIFTGNPE